MRAVARPGGELERSRRYSRGGADALPPRNPFGHAMRILDPQSLSQHVDRLYRAAWGLCGSREDAEDLVQETFARVLSRPRMLHGDDELFYLMRVLRNTFLTSRRTAGRRPVTVATLEDVVTADPRPTGRPEQALEIQELYATIAELPEDFRMALVAIDVLGLSYREAARSLRVREATITTRLFRARKQVAKRLADGPERTEREGRARAHDLGPATAHARDVGPATSPAHDEISKVKREQMRAGGVVPSRETP
jgi:RNA polymerase sigma-70 factor (ECF subfamily)